MSSKTSRNIPWTPVHVSTTDSIDQNVDEIGLEIIENGKPTSNLDTIPRQQSKHLSSHLPSVSQTSNDHEEAEEGSNHPRKRTLSLSIFLIEAGALIVVLILSMVLVVAIREEQTNLRTIMQIVYTYIYLISIIWIIWCAYDIRKFRRKWKEVTSTAEDQDDYMQIVDVYPHKIPYFPDIHNTGGLFMRVGAGLLCMGSLLLTIIELAKTIETIRVTSKEHDIHTNNYSQPVLITKSITFLFRFLFHCIQFIFLFQYGNIIIDRYHQIARFGLIHIVIANFCTWFEAIVIETVEELHKQSENIITTTTLPMIYNTTKTVEMTSIQDISTTMIDLFKAAPSEESSSKNSTKAILEFIENMQLTVGVYIYPCLIEYSLICVTVFYIMWRNVGKSEKRSFSHFADRHIFTINCSRASCGLLLGGIIFLSTIVTLLPVYILDLRSAVLITHITELVLLIVSLLIVCISFIYLTKLYYDDQAHVDIFDQILILITTVGNFAYSFFDLFASMFIQSYTIEIPRYLEILIGFLAIFQTFFQSAFILDALKRRSISKNELRNKPGRELITALLLINLAIWLHDSLSAKKVKLNPSQSEYYDPQTWSIIQAFTGPLSIFYRFHSSVCLADIWHEVYHNHNQSQENKDQKRPLTNINNISNHQF